MKKYNIQIKRHKSKQINFNKTHPKILKRNYNRMRSDLGVSRELKKESIKENKKYLFENYECNTSIKKILDIKNPSNKYSWEIAKNGDIHALKSHPEIKEILPNLNDSVKRILDNPTKIEKDEKYNNTIVFIKKCSETHHLRLYVLITPVENKIKSIRYQRTRKKDFKK